MHTVKSSSATFVIVPGVTFSGCPFMSRDVICSAGVQMDAPPLPGFVEVASTLKSTSPAAGTLYVKPEAENIPTLGLLAGTTSVYCAQSEFAGLPAGQAVLEVTASGFVEACAGLVVVAGALSSGMLNCRVVPPGTEMDCRAAIAASICAGAVPVVAVTKPCNNAGPLAPASPTRGIGPRL